LGKVEEGLRYVSSFLSVGTGIIDTLAIDDENNPVIIEFKAEGDFDKDALIQLMNYYSWFAEDESRLSFLKNVISKAGIAVDYLGEIKLMAVVSNLTDEAKNACFALEPRMKTISYSIVENSGGKHIVVPNIEIDTSIVRRSIREPKTEQDHLRSHENLVPIYKELKDRILKEIDPKVIFNAALQGYIGINAANSFGWAHFKKNWIRLDLWVTPDEVRNSQRYTHWKGSELGYIHLRSTVDVDQELISWIRMAYNKAK